MRKHIKEIEIAKAVLINNLDVKKAEKLLIVIDSTKRELGEIFYKAGEKIGAETLLIQYISREKSGVEPPEPVSLAMKEVDVTICITEHSISHTKARRQAANNLTRVATMPGLTLDMLAHGALKADYHQVQVVGNQVASILDKGKEVVIKTGTNVLSFNIDGRTSKVSSGLLVNPGNSGNLPSGETFIAPVEGTANGEILIDGSIAGVGRVSSPVLLRLKNGKLIEAEGKDGGKLLELLGEGDGRYLCELGIGTNPSARLTGNILEDEKKYGTCHIAFGSNHTFGGTISAGVHLDAVTLMPEVLVDEQILVVQGKILIEGK